jgi:8-oxo-dGTP diphosphatase
MPLYLVRHAHAGTRGRWDGPDLERPLSDKGRAQVDALTERLADVALTQVLSSVAVRCQQTVAPLASTRGLEVQVHDALTEGARARATTTLLWELASAGVTAALSSHGDVIPTALDALARDGVDVGENGGLPKGTYYVLDVVDGAITTATHVDPRP